MIQGFLIFMVILAITPFFADFYQQPMLLQLLTQLLVLAPLLLVLIPQNLATANRDLLMAKGNDS